MTQLGHGAGEDREVANSQVDDVVTWTHGAACRRTVAGCQVDDEYVDSTADVVSTTAREDDNDGDVA